MAKKIKETIERDCCHPTKDLKHLDAPSRPKGRRYFYCIHCGRQWKDLGMESTPGSDVPSGLQALPYPWEKS